MAQGVPSAWAYTSQNAQRSEAPRRGITESFGRTPSSSVADHIAPSSRVVVPSHPSLPTSRCGCFTASKVLCADIRGSRLVSMKEGAQLRRVARRELQGDPANVQARRRASSTDPRKRPPRGECFHRCVGDYRSESRRFHGDAQSADNADSNLVD